MTFTTNMYTTKQAWRQRRQLCLGAVAWWTRRNITRSLIMVHWLHYVKNWRRPQNRKYITHCFAIRGGPSYGRRQHVQKFCEMWSYGIWDVRARQTDRHTYTLIATLLRGGSAVGRWTCDLQVASSIPGRWLSRNIGQLSLASLRGR